MPSDSATPAARARASAAMSSSSSAARTGLADGFDYFDVDTAPTKTYNKCIFHNNSIRYHATDTL